MFAFQRAQIPSDDVLDEICIVSVRVLSTATLNIGCLSMFIDVQVPCTDYVQVQPSLELIYTDQRDDLQSQHKYKRKKNRL